MSPGGTVRAKLAARPEDYKWSSAAAHLKGADDILVITKPLLEMAADWKSFLEQEPSKDEINLLRKHETTGRPLGSEGFIKKLEKLFNRVFRSRSVGRPAKIRQEIN